MKSEPCLPAGKEKSHINLAVILSVSPAYRQAGKNPTHSSDSRKILKAMGSFRLRLQDDIGESVILNVACPP